MKLTVSLEPLPASGLTDSQKASGNSINTYSQALMHGSSKQLAAFYFFQSSERYRVDCVCDARMQLMYALLVLFQPAQRRRDHDVVKVLFLTLRSSQTDLTRFAVSGLYRLHHSVELDVRLGERNSGYLGNDLLVVGWYEAVVCRN